MTSLTILEKGLDVFTEIFLINLLVQRTVLVHDDALRFLVKILDLIPDSVVNTFIENSEDIVFFPDINVNIFEIFFRLE
jgi:bisphosphoglycerate-dependent phosphoglycerate mutase